MRKLLPFFTALIFVFFAVSRSGFAQNSVPPLGHVVVVAMENHSYGDVVGSPSMPYYNSLIRQGGLAQNFFANVHGSFPNYAMLTTGELITLTGKGLPDDFPISIDNIERELIAAGQTWKVYADSLPSVGYTGGDQYPYLKRHNPFAYMTDNLNGSAQANNIVPFSQFAADVVSNSLPNFSFIVPNAINDGEDCPGGGSCSDSTKLSTADQWLQTSLAPLLANSQFQQDGLLVIWWDEGNIGDTNFGGGQIALTLVGPTVKAGFRSSTFYRHENLLRTLCQGLGLGFPGASIYVASMAEFFGPKTTLPGTISGHVISSSTGVGLGSATVSYGGGSTTTDAGGSYTLSNVPAGSVSVTASLAGFTSQTAAVNVTSGATSTLNFALNPTGNTPGAFTGKVTNISTNGAISGATVSFSGGTTTTNTSGSYSFSSVAPGTYNVTVTHSGYFAVTMPVTIVSGGTSVINFALATGGRVAGTVTNASGAVIAGASVTITGGSISTTVHTTTSSAGTYNSNWVPVGTYTVTVSASGHTTQTKSANLTTGNTTTLNFTLQ